MTEQEALAGLSCTNVASHKLEVATGLHLLEADALHHPEEQPLHPPGLPDGRPLTETEALAGLSCEHFYSPNFLFTLTTDDGRTDPGHEAPAGLLRPL